MKIIFLHGLEGSPNGSKITKLRELNPQHNFIVPELSLDYQADLEKIQTYTTNDHFDLVIGSSRGGALASELDIPIKILIAPAIRKFAVAPKIDDNTVILHSRGDEIIPFEESLNLGCTVIETGSNHRMSDEATIQKIQELIGQFDQSSASHK